MKLFFTLALLLPFTVFSQNADSIKVRKRFYPLGIVFSPDYDFRVLKADPSEQWIANFRDSLEIPKFGFTCGFEIGIPFIKHLGLETGLLFSDKGEQTKKINLTWPQPDPSLPVSASYIYHYRYIDIPLKTDFMIARIQKISLKFLKRIMHGKIPTSDIGILLSPGISTNVFMNEKITSILEYNDGHTEKTHSSDSGLSRVNFAVTGGLGIIYQFTTRVQIQLETVYRQSITPIMSAPVKQYSYSGGLILEIYYYL